MGCACNEGWCTRRGCGDCLVSKGLSYPACNSSCCRRDGGIFCGRDRLILAGADVGILNAGGFSGLGIGGRNAGNGRGGGGGGFVGYRRRGSVDPSDDR